MNLQLEGNFLTGNISCFFDNTLLISYVDLGNNLITGKFPDIVNNDNTISGIDISQNFVSGMIMIWILQIYFNTCCLS